MAGGSGLLFLGIRLVGICRVLACSKRVVNCVIWLSIIAVSWVGFMSGRF